MAEGNDVRVGFENVQMKGWENAWAVVTGIKLIGI